jgi:hypothetical protein
MNKSAMPVEWHEEGLKNRKIYVKRKIEELTADVKRLERDIKDMEFLTLQINTAKKMGKPRFNEELFLQMKARKKMKCQD